MSHSVLILHGRGGSRESRKTVGEHLQKKGYTVYIPDLPGFGNTTLPHVFSVQDYAIWIKDYLADTNTTHDTLSIIAHSNGGRIALFGLEQGILSADNLILVNSAGIDLAHDPSWKRKTKRIFGHALASLAKKFALVPGYRQIRSFFYTLLGGRDYLHASENPIMKETFINCFTHYCEQAMKSITIPTLIIWGEDDTYTPLRQGKKMHSLISTSDFIVYKGKKHGIHISDPELLVDTIDRFLCNKNR